MKFMKKILTLVTWSLFPAIALVVLFFVSPSFALFGKKIESFSADYVTIAPNGKIQSTSKYYITPDAQRIDGMPGMDRGGMAEMNLSILVLKKQDKQYMYNHDKKLVFESPVDEENMQGLMKDLNNAKSEKVLGKEKVSGYKCVKKEVVTSMNIMGMTHTDTNIIWQSDRFDMPLRVKDERGEILEMRNIKTGKPPSKIFKPLTGYNKVTNMMALMGVDFGAMMAEEDAAQDVKEEEKEVDVNAMMNHLQKSIGDKMSPEDKEMMMGIMGQVMGQAAGQTPEGGSASEQLWQVIPRHGNDQVGYEMKIHNNYDVVLGTNSTLQQVFGFYIKELTSLGWQDRGAAYRTSQSKTMHLMKGDVMLQIALAEKPSGMKGDYKVYYNLHYTGTGR